jgi:protein TonB
MQSFNTRENASDESRGESARSCRKGPGDENLQWQLAIIFSAVLLLHIMLIDYLRQSPEAETPAQPLVMDVALLAAPAPSQAKPAPPAPPSPPVAQPKPRPAPPKPKKAPALPKKTPPVRQPALKPAPTSEPVAKAEAAAPAAPNPAPATPSAAAAPAASAPSQQPLTEANYRANYKSNPKPEYPRLAKSRGWQGRVLLRVQVTADGRSAAVTVQQSSGHRQLDDAAVAAVEQWIFIPAKRGTTPVASTVTVPIQFTLNP